MAYEITVIISDAAIPCDSFLTESENSKVAVGTVISTANGAIIEETKGCAQYVVFGVTVAIKILGTRKQTIDMTIIVGALILSCRHVTVNIAAGILPIAKGTNFAAILNGLSLCTSS